MIPCPVCAELMSVDDVVWIVANRFVCSEQCARLLQARHASTPVDLSVDGA